MHGWHTMAVFMIFLSRNYVRQTSILDTNKYKIRKNKYTYVTSTFKIDTLNGLLFFQILHSLLVPKINIHFLDENSLKTVIVNSQDTTIYVGTYLLYRPMQKRKPA